MQKRCKSTIYRIIPSHLVKNIIRLIWLEDEVVWERCIQNNNNKINYGLPNKEYDDWEIFMTELKHTEILPCSEEER